MVKDSIDDYVIEGLILKWEMRSIAHHFTKANPLSLEHRPAAIDPHKIRQCRRDLIAHDLLWRLAAISDVQYLPPNTSAIVLFLRKAVDGGHDPMMDLVIRLADSLKLIFLCTAVIYHFATHASRRENTAQGECQ